MRPLTTAILSVMFFALAGYANAGGPGIALYGNWCGPGTDLTALPPLDPLDEACMRHDMCYASTGSVACECDVAFMGELRRIPYPNKDLYLRARAMYDALAMTPCDTPTGWAVKQSLMWSDIASDAANGRALPFEVPARWLYLFSHSNPYY